MNKEEPAIVVLGSGRSGTSMIAGILHHLGVVMGQDFIEPTSANKLGFFEDIDFFDLNQNRIRALSDREQALQEIKTLFRQKRDRAKGARWGFKHPMTADLIRLYLETEEPMTLILADRPVEDSVESYMKAFNLLREVAEYFTYHRIHVLEQIEKEGLIDLKINFADTINNPRKVVESIIETCNLEPTPEQVERAVHSIR